MKTSACIWLFCLLVAGGGALAQKRDLDINDTSYTTVNLRHFKPGKKVAQIEYGKVTVYARQQDYFGRIQKKDTVVITPKYLDDWKLVQLLESGRARVYRIATGEFVPQITHHLKRYADVYELFQFTDSTVFLMKRRFHISLFNNSELFFSSDSLAPAKRIPKPRVKEFEWPEVFADSTDRTAVNTRDYLPLMNNQFYVYDDGNRYGERDTIVCRRALLSGKPVFYFRETYDKFGVYPVSYTYAGEGLLYYQNDSLFTIPCDYEREIKESRFADARLFLPAVLKPGDSAVRENTWNKKVLSLVKKEDVMVRGRLLKDCILLKMLTYWEETVYLSYYWLQKNVGLVKWQRDTGREDELVDYFTK
jgi:hypothetical protein